MALKQVLCFYSKWKTAASTMDFVVGKVTCPCGFASSVCETIGLSVER